MVIKKCGPLGAVVDPLQRAGSWQALWTYFVILPSFTSPLRTACSQGHSYEACAPCHPSADLNASCTSGSGNWDNNRKPRNRVLCYTLPVTQIFLFLSIYLLGCTHQVLAIAWGILVSWLGVEPKPPAIGSVESLSLDYQGSPSDIFIFLFTDDKTEVHQGAVVTQTHIVTMGKNLEMNLDFLLWVQCLFMSARSSPSLLPLWDHSAFSQLIPRSWEKQGPFPVWPSTSDGNCPWA